MILESKYKDYMADWLEHDLEQNNQKWTVVLVHYPGYSKGSHDSDDDNVQIDIREGYFPILEAGGVDLVLSGHSHSYERSYLMNGHYGSSYNLSSSMILDDGDGKIDGDGAYQKPATGNTQNTGTVYAVVGSSGKLNNDNSLDHPAMAYSKAIYGSASLKVEGNQMDFKFIDNYGTIKDYFTIQKGAVIIDNDNDGFSSEVDCNDFDPAINPGALEIANNDIDENCDEIILFAIDNDNDGVIAEEDCDDNNSAIPTNPGTPCNDQNPVTTNDAIQSDGCSCAGIIIPPTEEYCESKGQNPWQEWIDNIQLNTFDHGSSKRKYSDFTEVMTTLNTGSSYPIYLTTGFSYQTYDEYFRVWIDYNQNNVFEEPTEIAFSGIISGLPNGIGTGTLEGIIDVPTEALTGATRMRISMRRGAYADPCGTFPIGEVEDYGLMINNEVAPSEITLSNCPQEIIRTSEPGVSGNTVTWPTPSATTTCQSGSINLTQTGGPLSGSFFEAGSTTLITYTATDECENEEICNFNVIINATNDGEITYSCPDGITLTIPAGNDGVTLNWVVPSASTTCSVGGLDIAQITGPENGTFLEVGTHQIIYEFTDACSNLESCGLSINILSEVIGISDYCEPESDFPYEDWIGRVQLNTIDQASGKSKYSDFTNTNTTLVQNESYNIELTTEYSWATYDEYWKVWIDYNKNGIFEEASELAYSGVGIAPPGGTEYATLNGSIQIPSNALLGETRMRVIMKRGAPPESCEDILFGEIEDYHVVIAPINNNSILGKKVVANLKEDKKIDSTAKEINPIFKLYPNPSSDHIFIETNLDEEFQASIYNAVGKKVNAFKFTNSVNKIDVSNLGKGLFIVSIISEKSGQRKVLKFEKL